MPKKQDQAATQRVINFRNEANRLMKLKPTPEVTLQVVDWFLNVADFEVEAIGKLTASQAVEIERLKSLLYKNFPDLP